MKSRLDQEDSMAEMIRARDSWEKDWGWAVEDEPKPKLDKQSPVDLGTETQGLAPTKESYLVSASAGGRHLVLAYKTKFVMVEANENEGEYAATGQGSGCESAG
ncbi:hypothetical protein F4703DRAFT_1113204 [Phycomyces blakesleeanus]